MATHSNLIPAGAHKAVATALRPVNLAALAVALLWSRRCKEVLVLPAACALLAGPAGAWERGNHAGDWVKGGKVTIAVDKPPGDAAQQAAYLAALDEAMAEWNTAQKTFGGLTLELTVAANPDVTISWKDKAAEWGAVAAGKGPVKVTIESDDGINARGVTRILKHELGHVEGLGHSAASALMRADAYSSTPGQVPSAADLNAAAAFTDPTADDLAGKKAMWGTVEKLSKSEAISTATPAGGGWFYQFHLFAQAGPGLADPVTQFMIDLAPGVTLANLAGIQQPNGWSHQFFSGVVSGGERPLDITEAPSPSLLSFFALSSSAGLLPGQQGEFSFSSAISPTQTRAFTNSPSFDSDEFVVASPMAVPELSTLALMAAGLAGLAALRARRAPG